MTDLTRFNLDMGGSMEQQTGVGSWCAPGPAAEQKRMFVLRFEDQDRGEAHYTDEAEARAMFARAEACGWNCHLFVHVNRVAPVAPAGEPMRKDSVNWVVNDLGELGVCVNGRYFFLYKGDNIEYGTDVDDRRDGVALHDDGTPMMVRMVGKREFGETCHPITCMKAENGVIYDRTPRPYRNELIYTPGLSDGEPGDGNWRPLPAPVTPVAVQSTQAVQTGIAACEDGGFVASTNSVRLNAEVTGA